MWNTVLETMRLALGSWGTTFRWIVCVATLTAAAAVLAVVLP
jgi:hypothetical protein